MKIEIQNFKKPDFFYSILFCSVLNFYIDWDWAIKRQNTDVWIRIVKIQNRIKKCKNRIKKCKNRIQTCKNRRIEWYSQQNTSRKFRPMSCWPNFSYVAKNPKVGSRGDSWWCKEGKKAYEKASNVVHGHSRSSLWKSPQSITRQWLHPSRHFFTRLGTRWIPFCPFLAGYF
mgnify:CR=1 FL=1